MLTAHSTHYGSRPDRGSGWVARQNVIMFSHNDWLIRLGFVSHYTYGAAQLGSYGLKYRVLDRESVHATY